jgi:hypothetical protein
VNFFLKNKLCGIVQLYSLSKCMNLKNYISRNKMKIIFKNKIY